MSNALALPASGDASTWTPQEAALAEAAGLVNKGRIVPRPVAEAFLHHCNRTGLDPVARQIYLVERGGKHTIQVSIDGMRLIAERSGQYRGQTPVQWTADGVTWLDVWLDKNPPAAARVGVYREGYNAPVVAVANFDAYSAGGPMWKKMPALMIAKCAEMLALRKAFPQDLSGLYGTEEMEQAGGGTETSQAAPEQAPPAPAQPELEHNDEIATQWIEAIDAAPDKVTLRSIREDAKKNNALRLAVKHPAPAPGLPEHISLDQYIRGTASQLPENVEGDEAEGEAPKDLMQAAQEAINSDEENQ